jgi:1,4-dihydroxy-6-naphthoate synthase
MKPSKSFLMKSDPIRIGLSPCPNDTFIFDAMLHGKVDTEGLTFKPLLTDVEELNRLAFAGKLAATKVSYHAFLHLVKDYVLLEAGSALGRGCGPLLIAKEKFALDEIVNKKIAIPGLHTTANLLCSIAFPDATNKTELLFSQIEDAVLRNEYDCGLIIHENRFTYADKGLKCIMDLGEFWEGYTGLPIPLGGIIVQRKLPLETQHKLNRIMKRSVEYAFAHPLSSKDFVAKHAQDMREEIIRAHIDLYVNKFTLSLDAEGKNAVERLFIEAKDIGLISNLPASIFISPAD